MTRPIVRFAAAVLMSSSVLAQEQRVIIQTTPGAVPAAPARDTQQKTGTSVLKGQVFGADTGAPLRRAQVRATNMDNREARATSTDAQGRFELKELPAGRYAVTAGKGSYVMLQYGQTRPNEQGKPLQLDEGQTIDRVEFKLPRGGIVTGKIVDEFGEPLSDAMVVPMRYQFFNGQRRLIPVGGRFGQTNDIGEYRLFGLAPGQYYITASMRAMGGQMAESDDRSGYAPTYYPGTSNVAEAQRVTIATAQEVSNINMALAPIRTAKVTGTAVDSSGRPMAGAMVLIMQVNGGMMFTTTAGNQVKPDGSFSLSNLAPGEYILQAQSGGLLGGDSEFAMTPVTVAGEDVTGVRLAAMKPSSLVGQIVIEDGIQPSFPPTAVMPRAQSATPEIPFSGSGAGRVNDDWTFEIKARPGKAYIRAITPPGFSLKAVLQNGTDITDTPIDVRGDQAAEGFQIVLTSHVSEIDGLVTDARGEQTKEYAVVVFPDDREKWNPQTRYIATGRPDQDGRFKVRALPPGEYMIVALDYIEQGDAFDPDFLERVKPKAMRILLGEGETKVLDLKLSPLS